MSGFSRTDLAKLIIERMKKPENSHRLAREIAEFLLAEGRTRDVDALMRTVAAIREQTDGVTEATMSSAFELDGDIKQQLEKLLGANKLILNSTIDKSLLGGVQVETQDRVLDLSVASQLAQLKRTTNKGTTA